MNPKTERRVVSDAGNRCPTAGSPGCVKALFRGVLAVLAMAWGLAPVPGLPQDAGQGAAKLVCEAPLYDFGAVADTGEVRHVFLRSHAHPGRPRAAARRTGLR